MLMDFLETGLSITFPYNVIDKPVCLSQLSDKHAGYR